MIFGQRTALNFGGSFTALFVKKSIYSFFSGVLIFLAAGTMHLRATCPGCTSIGSGVNWGTTMSGDVDEASGLAVSAQNPGVFWAHNDDGNDGRLYAFRTNGAWLARFTFALSLGDVEDMALGPGPVNGASYLYVGDIGGAAEVSGVRSSVIIVRIPEPAVSLAWEGATRNLFFAGVQYFHLTYPDGSYDAETLLLDPVSGDIFVGTKQNSGTRIYRANLNAAANNDTVMMEFVRTVPFTAASGGSISANGGRIVLRRENAAQMWTRCAGESISAALSRAGQGVPIIGPPTEPNGEAIAFLPDNSGYLTISDSALFPPVFFFPALCSLTAPGTEITQQPQSIQVEAGADVQLMAQAGGTNLTYQWRRGTMDLPGATSPTLLLTNIQPGQAGSYTLFVSGDGGAAQSNPAFVGVAIRPPVIVTQMPLLTLAATGSTVNLSVALQGTPPFTFRWTKSGKTLPVITSPLILSNVQKTNAGKYHVVVSNSSGVATSTDTQLKILFPPVLLIHPASRSAVAGSKVVLRAKAKGSPKLQYQWLFNNVPILGAIKPQLVLTAVQPGQSGNYSVVVTNAVGTATSAAAELLVQ